MARKLLPASVGCYAQDPHSMLDTFENARHKQIAQYCWPKDAWQPSQAFALIYVLFMHNAHDFKTHLMLEVEHAHLSRLSMCFVQAVVC